MTDKELLELAAKAAGLKSGEIENNAANSHQTFYVWNDDGKTSRFWNPLADDGDALRLLCKRSMRIVEDHGGACRAVQFTLHPETDEEAEHEIEIEWPHTPAATRRAITRAAAEIGKEMS